jgi:poly-gamma-glutamate capsule biosynthesis protein CapA/YwtB (metallophosphatase superfamily)
MRDGGVIPV